MEPSMSRNVKIVIAIATLLAMATITAFVASYAFNNQTHPQTFPFQRQPQQVNISDLEFYYVARTVFSAINITLLVVVLITYISIYQKTRSQFTIGLLLFAMVFLIKDIAASPFIPGAFGFGLFGLGPFVLWWVLLPDLFELIALSVLVYLSIKY
jgi:hypothetical protein